MNTQILQNHYDLNKSKFVGMSDDDIINWYNVKQWNTKFLISDLQWIMHKNLIWPNFVDNLNDPDKNKRHACIMATEIVKSRYDYIDLSLPATMLCIDALLAYGLISAADKQELKDMGTLSNFEQLFGQLEVMTYDDLSQIYDHIRYRVVGTNGITIQGIADVGNQTN